ncbi:MAG: hypothetical protein ACK5B9_04480 [Flavobacteriia bacterium]|jgi:hypothetical protein
MALEEKDYDETGQENNSSQEIQAPKVVAVDENIVKLVSDLQKEIAELKQQRGVAPAQTPLDQATLLEKLVDKINGNNKTDSSSFIFEHNYVSEQDIDPDDVLPKDEWVTFVTHTVGYPIVDDVRNGKPVRVPFGVIKFDYDSTKQVKNGKETDVFNLSKYICKSKKELAWLKSHSKYGSLFFDNIKGARSVDGAKAIKLASVMRGLSAMGQHDIVSTARNYGLSVDGDLNSLRGEIAQIIVDRQMNQEKMSSELRVSEAGLEAEIVGRQIK